MQNLQRNFRVFTLIALFMATITIFSQESTEEAPDSTAVIEETEGSSINVVGSGVVNPALEALAEASASIIEYNFSTTGSGAGFEQFCAGSAEIATSIRPIGFEEDTLCREAGVEYLELLIGYDITVVISNVDDNFLSCLTNDSLNALFAPSASASNWSEINLDETAQTGATPEPEATEEAVILPEITVLLPEDNSLTYETLDSLVSGFGFRSDAESMDVDSIIETVQSTPGAIGVVSLEAAIATDVSVFPVNLNLNGIGCVQPSISAVEATVYTAATPLYMYVASEAQETLAFFLNFLTDSASFQPLVDAGYSLVSVAIVELNSAIVRGEISARSLTADDITFNIPPGLTGAIKVVGATSGFNIASSNTARLASTQQTLTINNDFVGQIAGVEAFCNGDAGILFVNSGTDAVCDNDVAYMSYEFGQQAVVLIGNADDEFSTCLTLDQISNIWSATSADTVTQWSNVSDSLPEQDLILVGLSAGNIATDILMTNISEGAALPIRGDVAESNRDPAYRATAVGIVPGALTYMSYADYLAVSGNGDNIQLVAIDTDNDCVVPDETTIVDGTYPLSRSTTMLVKASELAKIEVQSFVWSIFDDANLSIIDAQDFVGGFAEQDIVEFRTALLADFSAAQLAVLSTPEVTPEATEEASDD